MTPALHTLTDGSTLQRKGGGWFDPLTQRYVEYDRLPGSLTVPGSNPPEIVRDIGPAAGATRPSPRARGAAAGGAAADRFQAINSFVDDIARHLSPLEVAVWVVLWRRADARSNVAEISVEAIADKLGVSGRSVQRAVQWLLRVGLMERLLRGTRQAGVSRYRVEPRPATRLPAVADAAARRAAMKKPRLATVPQHDTRDRLGKFST